MTAQYCYTPKTLIRRTQWKSGPDPELHNRYYAWLKHRAQAQFRGEGHELSWDDWQHFWTDNNWSERGRKAEHLCLTRKDWHLPWSRDNCEIITRMEQFRRQGMARMNIPRGPYAKRK